MAQHETVLVRQYFISANVLLHSLVHYFRIIKCLIPSESQKQQQCGRVLYAFCYRMNFSIQTKKFRMIYQTPLLLNGKLNGKFDLSSNISYVQSIRTI